MPEFVWLNDDLSPLDQARVSVNDRGFLYGDGFFETLRADQGRVWFLKEHLERLKASAQAFRLPWPDSFPWEERVRRLLAANGLHERPARVRIQLTRGEALGMGLPRDCRPTVVIWAQSYVPPPPEEYAAGWPVAVFPPGRSTFIGRHKSLNYLFYLAARQHALDQGAREAIVLEADGLVSEGAATNLLYLHDGRFFAPDADSALPGVTIQVISRGLAAGGHPLAAFPTTLDKLEHAEGLWLANSLMGLMPVASLNGVPLPLSPQNRLLQEVMASLIAADRESSS